MRALESRDLLWASTRGLTLTVIAAPVLVVVAAAIREVGVGWPGVTWLSAWQLGGALFAGTAVLAAVLSARHPAPARLDSARRGELMGVATVVGFAGGVALCDLHGLPPALTLGLTGLAAMASGSLAGSLLWRGDLFAGAILGWFTAGLGLLGSLGANAVGAVLLIYLDDVWSFEVRTAAQVSLVLAGCFLATVQVAAGLSAADPLVPHSVLERGAQRRSA